MHATDNDAPEPTRPHPGGLPRDGQPDADGAQQLCEAAQAAGLPRAALPDSLQDRLHDPLHDNPTAFDEAEAIAAERQRVAIIAARAIERHRRIAQAAHRIAARHGYAPGRALADWREVAAQGPILIEVKGTQVDGEDEAARKLRGPFDH